MNISALATDCRFRDCSHQVDDGCALLEAIALGELDQARETGKLHKRILSENTDRRP